jgi:hypothetical protein
MGKGAGAERVAAAFAEAGGPVAAADALEDSLGSVKRPALDESPG